jgi:hypothetical protein
MGQARQRPHHTNFNVLVAYLGVVEPPVSQYFANITQGISIFKWQWNYFQAIFPFQFTKIALVNQLNMLCIEF